MQFKNIKFFVSLVYQAVSRFDFIFPFIAHLCFKVKKMNPHLSCRNCVF